MSPLPKDAYDVTETCRCGAQFAMTSTYYQYLQSSVREWREKHVCGEPR